MATVDLTDEEMEFINVDFRTGYGSPIDGYVESATARSILRKIAAAG